KKEPSFREKLVGYILNDSIPAQAVKGAWSGFTLPGDVVSGKVDPMSEEGRRRALDAAGMAVTGNIAAGLLRKPRGLVAAAKEMEHDPPKYPQRPFEADYPNGATADETGRLQFDIDGRPLTARYVTGRTRAGLPDRALSAEELAGVVEGRTGRGVERGDRGQIDGAAGGTYFDLNDGSPVKVVLADDLHPNDVPRVLGHETGHVIDQTAGNIPTAGIEDHLRQNYDTLYTGNNPGSRQIGPEALGYPGEQVPQELMAEAIRAYLTDPNYLKTVGPEIAVRIRAFVNEHPKLKDIIQFNAFPAGVIGAGLASDEQFQQAWRRGDGA
ncbi:MAG TPA: hypothetical protein VFG14_08640, partial [Chthoniobacteraceae bacterium]|nr:hypothetical protein [Chthoniobacteraceae bacterium]